MSYKLYEGPSLLDGNPILVALTGIENPSRNIKTGPMAQTWVLRADMNPLEASRTGADKSICGDCPFRGHDGKERTCYVNIAWAPFQIFKNKDALKPLPKNVFRHRAVRVGAYGDPAAIPTKYTADIHKRSAVATGYTHQWRTCDPELRKYLMASCNSEADYEQAKSRGWSTFRVKNPEDKILRGETVCPASDEAGKLMTCYTCGRCKGNTARDVVINVHGMGQRHFKLLQETT
jgi:hypothetical protein